MAAAIEVLEDIERRHRPVVDALKDWGLSHRFAGAGDRAAIGNIVYDALRRKRSAGWLLGAETPRALGFGALLLDGLTPERLNTELDGDRFTPPPLDDAERATIGKQRKAPMPEAVAADCPDWCVPLLRGAYGEGWVAEAKALAARPPLDLRINTLKANRSRVLAELEETGVAPAAIAPNGLRIPPIAGYGRHPNVQAEPAFRQGWFEVQDEGSQIVAHLAGVVPGMEVLDFCAGAGGKTLALAALMRSTGQVFACDVSAARLARLKPRLARAGASNVQPFAIDRETDPKLDRLAGRADLVLVDAPCSGTGTLRRNPDLKWRLQEHEIGELQARQLSILRAAARLVKPGGALVYATCSLLPDENEAVASGFESAFESTPRSVSQSTTGATGAAGPRFVREPVPESLTRTGADVGPSHDSRSLVLRPDLHGCDGFFAVRWKRVNA